MKVLYLLLLTVLLFFQCECPPVTIKITSNHAQEGILKICVIDVDQGDAILIISPDNKHLLIDGGNTGKGNSEIIPLLDSLRINRLDYVFVSHYDADHIGGLDEVINHISKDSLINYCYDSGSARNTNPFLQYKTSIDIKRKTIYPGYTIDINNVKITCVCANGKLINGDFVNVKNINDSSVGLIISYKNFRFFTAGDLSGENSGDFKDVETKLAPLVGNIDVYKVSHHASKHSTNSYFINTIKPEASVISLGQNSYGHPSQIVINRLINAGSKIYQTNSSNYGQISQGKGKIVQGDIWIIVYNSFYIVNTDTFYFGYI